MIDHFLSSNEVLFFVVLTFGSNLKTLVVLCRNPNIENLIFKKGAKDYRGWVVNKLNMSLMCCFPNTETKQSLEIAFRSIYNHEQAFKKEQNAHNNAYGGKWLSPQEKH